MPHSYFIIETLLDAASSQDQDGIRDGIDPCPRNPFGGKAKDCSGVVDQTLLIAHLVTEIETQRVPAAAAVGDPFANAVAVAVPTLATIGSKDSAEGIRGLQNLKKHRPALKW